MRDSTTCYEVVGFTPVHHRLELYDCVSLVPLSSPGNLRVSEEWYNRLKVTWDPPQSPAVGYRIVYQPVYGTQTCSILVFFSSLDYCVIDRIDN